MKRLLLLASILIGLSACSVEGQITDMTEKTLKPKMGELTGLISGSQQNHLTPEGYRVSSSVGAPFSGKTDTVTAEGYTIHTNVQGNINSETYDIITE